MSREHLRPPWQPGQSGNPRGRPNTSGLIRAIRKRYGANAEKLLEALAEIAFGRKVPPASRVAALRELLNRGWGTPVESVQIDLQADGAMQTVVIHEHRVAEPQPLQQDSRAQPMRPIKKPPSAY